MSFGSAKVHLVGNVGGDPEMKYSQNGTAMTTFSVAVNRRRGPNDDPNEPNPPDWYRCTVFGKQAEIASDFIRKGSRLYVDGRQEIDKWTGQDGTLQTTVKVIVNDFVLLTGKDEATEQRQPVAAAPSRKVTDDDLDRLPF